MSELEPFEPLEPDVLDLLAVAKPIAELDGARRDAIFATAAARIGLPGGPPDGGSNEGGGVNDGGGAATSFMSAKGLLVVASTFLVGVGAGVVGDRLIAEKTAVVAAPSSVAAASLPPTIPARPLDTAPTSFIVESPSIPARSLPEAVPSSPRPGPSAAQLETTPNEHVASSTPSARGLAAERALLDVARSALARGESGEALSAAERHGGAYPDGTLVEEREAIAIKALVALGRGAEARTRAAAFERRFPHGLMLGAVRAAAFGPP